MPKTKIIKNKKTSVCQSLIRFTAGISILEIELRLIWQNHLNYWEIDWPL